MKNRNARAPLLSLTALAYACALLSLLSFVTTAGAQTPAPVSAERAGKAKTAKTATAKTTTERATLAKAAPASPLPIVREVDLAGLKKLLQRDPAKARPLLINFWATWCEPCREEFPDLVKIDEQYRERGLEFIIVSLDDVTDIQKGVPEYLQQMHAQMPAYLLNVPDPQEVITLVDPKWTGSMPTTFLYDAQGGITYEHTGRIKPDDLRAAIEKVTSKKSSDE